MGRKGIGKLSLFSIAKTVRVETAKEGHKNALSMDLDDIQASIGTGDPSDTGPTGRSHSIRRPSTSSTAPGSP